MAGRAARMILPTQRLLVMAQMTLALSDGR